MSSSSLSWGGKKLVAAHPSRLHKRSTKERKKELVCQFHYFQQAYVLYTVIPVLNIYITTSQQTVSFHKVPAKVISHSQAAAILLCPFQGLNFSH